MIHQALATGSNVILNPERSVYLSSMNFLSPEGLSYSFDHRASGYGRGEGVVVLVLKRLHDAIRDRDRIRAVLRASGSNQDGRTPGITQPSLAAQEKLIRDVYKSCNIGFESTRYVEAHGKYIHLIQVPLHQNLTSDDQVLVPRSETRLKPRPSARSSGQAVLPSNHSTCKHGVPGFDQDSNYAQL